MATHYNDDTAIGNFSHSRNSLYLRQRMLGWDPTGPKDSNTNAITLTNHHDNVVVAANVMGHTGTQTDYNGNGSIGGSSIFNVHSVSNATLLRLGNYNTVTGGIPAAETTALAGNTVAASYLYTSKPSWFGNLPWPWVDPSNYAQSNNPQNFPAGYRAINGMDPGGILPPPLANTFYIRDGATGTTCTDWGSNACDQLPSTLLRGATYYITSGIYGGRTFNTAASGAQVITIKGATAADHGVDTGWQASYSVSAADGGTQATWTSSLIFNTSHWAFDGAVGPTGSRTKTAYGFKINPINNAIQVFNLTSSIQNITLSHLTATAASGDVEKMFLITNNQTQSVHRVTLRSCLLDGWQNVIWATSAGLAMNDWLVEYNVILNGFSSATWHGEDINNNYGNLVNLVVRHNWFEGRSSGTGTIVVLNGAAGPYYIYGNVFKNQTSGDGTIAGVHFNMQAFIYNNIFANLSGGAWAGDSVSGEAYNNLFYNTNAAPGGATSITQNYNAFFNTTNTPTETHRYSSNSNPFVDYANSDLRLTAATAAAMPAGLTMAPPYNVDSVGSTRGADNVWDRGAYEFNSGSSGSACDVNHDTATNVTDVQQCVNQAIGIAGCSTGDINQDSQCNVIDVQRVVNAALGGPCVTQ